MYCRNRFKEKSQKTQLTFSERKYERFRPEKSEANKKRQKKLCQHQNVTKTQIRINKKLSTQNKIIGKK